LEDSTKKKNKDFQSAFLNILTSQHFLKFFLNTSLMRKAIEVQLFTFLFIASEIFWNPRPIKNCNTSEFFFNLFKHIYKKNRGINCLYICCRLGAAGYVLNTPFHFQFNKMIAGLGL
jgi:hypothetical protein